MSSSFSFTHPTTTTDDLENLYTVYGVDCAIVLDLASASETPKTVRGGYFRAYLSFFQSCSLTFPIPEPILEILAELGLSFTQILPNFLRHLIAFLIRAREEGISFRLGEFHHLFLVKRNMQSPATFLVSPRPGRHVIEDVPYRDEKWREQFFVFKVDRVRPRPGCLSRGRYLTSLGPYPDRTSKNFALYLKYRPLARANSDPSSRLP
ncbi:hypothetical protein F2Q68_00034006 [Brassica cretica]|uniref:Uncharacterized protein n=1 Tax=Brassica cretica TaxID=69181 RepID=A0A8S9H991_BRACR|nr:hypothetical protein F2Q68_00034006 [Brassica cretica]